MDFLKQISQKYPEMEPLLPAILQAAQVLEACYRKGGKLLLCGNGGSAADCEHIVGELMKGYFRKRPLPAELRARFLQEFPQQGPALADHLQGVLPAISLVSQVSLLTACMNDIAADMIFAQQVFGYGRQGDVLLGISTSGRSASVLQALRVARVCGLKTIGLTGQSGGEMKDLCDVVICVPQKETPEIQERHAAIYHALCAYLEERFFAE